MALLSPSHLLPFSLSLSVCVLFLSFSLFLQLVWLHCTAVSYHHLPLLPLHRHHHHLRLLPLLVCGGLFLSAFRGNTEERSDRWQREESEARHHLLSACLVLYSLYSLPSFLFSVRVGIIFSLPFLFFSVIFSSSFSVCLSLVAFCSRVRWVCRFQLGPHRSLCAERRGRHLRCRKCKAVRKEGRKEASKQEREEGRKERKKLRERREGKGVSCIWGKKERRKTTLTAFSSSSFLSSELFCFVFSGFFPATDLLPWICLCFMFFSFHFYSRDCFVSFFHFFLFYLFLFSTTLMPHPGTPFVLINGQPLDDVDSLLFRCLRGLFRKASSSWLPKSSSTTAIHSHQGPNLTVEFDIYAVLCLGGFVCFAVAFACRSSFTQIPIPLKFSFSFFFFFLHIWMVLMMQNFWLTFISVLPELQGTKTEADYVKAEKRAGIRYKNAKLPREGWDAYKQEQWNKKEKETREWWWWWWWW